jgi:large exoprotein involved in heme utilization and adhesion
MHDGLISPGLNAFFTPSPDGGEVNIRVSGEVTITGTDVDFLSNLVPGVFTQAGSFLTPELIPDAKVPDITIEGGGSFTLSGAASVKTDRLGPGAPAEVFIKADTVTVKDGASIVSLNFFEGPGSNITINARQVELSNDGTASPTGIAGISAQNLVHPSAQNLVFPCCDAIPPGLTFADAGSVTVNAAETVSVFGDALILTDSLGLGRGGDITINTGDLAVIGAGAETAGIKGQSAFAGNAGNITINASGAIELRDGGQIAGTTVGSGKGSSVTVTAEGPITFSGPDSRIVNATAPLPLDQLNALFAFSFGKSFETLRDELGLPADADVFDVLGALTSIPDLAAGDAGALSITTPALTLNADTRIEMSTGWEGNAGVVQADVGSLFLNNGGAINSRSGIERLSGEVIVGTGNAGAVNVTATDTISILRSPSRALEARSRPAPWAMEPVGISS